jgi:hypothetical protein
VQQVYSQIEQAWTDGFWRYLSQRNMDFLRTQVAPLLRFVAGVDVAAATFTNKVERLKVEILTDGAKPGTLESMAEDVSRLPDFVFEDSQRRGSADFYLKVNSLLSFLPELFEIEALPDDRDVVRPYFEDFIVQRQFNSNQIHFLRAVQNVFLKKRRLEVPDLSEAPLDRFGEDTVERWFT